MHEKPDFRNCKNEVSVERMLAEHNSRAVVARIMNRL
jgi:hypothetical protein